MKKYDCFIVSNSEVIKLCGKKVNFENGFMTDRIGDPDWLNILQSYVGKPVVRIANSDRESWEEIFVFCADGYLTEEGIPVLRGSVSELEDVLHDIFTEADNDEYEVFDCFQYEITDDGTYEELYDYVHEVW